MIADLEAKLVAISGYDAVSLQPNSGAQVNTRDCSQFVPTIAPAATCTAPCA